MISFAFGDRLREHLLPRKPPRILDWAARTVVIPDGPHKGQLFDPNTQPFARLFLAEIDSGRWNRIVATGPTQTGKSFLCYVVPVCFHLFAIGETVVAGLPTADMADDKWRADFLPVIESSPALRELLPATGQGSRSGRVRTSVRFRNGATLRFMTGGGGDKSRAGFTSRVLGVTEVDGLDQSSEGSREADKLKQLEARQRAYLSVGTMTYLECTVTTTTGRIWQEYIGGSESRIVRPCPHCGEFVTPERDCLRGWQEAEDELQARVGAAWHCPSCDEPWTEAQRYAANRRSVLAHRGQTVSKDGEIIGPPPATRTLGFRWTAVDNHFASAGDVAADEWAAGREVDRENAEKELRQFVHCLPYDPPTVAMTPLTPEEVAARVVELKKGVVPPNCAGITVGIDTGKRALHWTAIAWGQDWTGHVIDYGMKVVDSDRLGVHQGLANALASLAGYFQSGWQGQVPRQVWIDSGYHEHQEAVYAFCELMAKSVQPGAEIYRPMKGYGEGQRRMDRYYAPKKTTQEIRFIGNGFHLAKARGKMLLVHVNSDHWKSELHQRFAIPRGEPLSMVLYEASDASQHREYSEQLTAERQIEKWIEGRGEQIVWERIRRQNHYLDASYVATAAGELVRMLGAKQARPQQRTMAEMAAMARGRR